MDCDRLLTLATELGYGLLKSGAEIYRVEESIQRVLTAYGVGTGEPFVIPNCIIVSLVTPEGVSLTRVKRMPVHGTDIDLLERYNALSRSLCATAPPVEEALARLDDIGRTRRDYPFWLQLAAYFVGAAAFTLFFGGNGRDSICGGLCGVAAGLCLTGLARLLANSFFRVMVGAAASAFLAHALVFLGLGVHPSFIIIGALMTLVPGVVFTNAIRDVMAGDMMAGISKVADALLTGVSIAVGTGFALWLTRLIWGVQTWNF